MTIRPTPLEPTSKRICEFKVSLEYWLAPSGTRKKPMLPASTSLCSALRLRLSPALTPAHLPSSLRSVKRMPASPVRALYQPIVLAYPASSELSVAVSVVGGLFGAGGFGLGL